MGYYLKVETGIIDDVEVYQSNIDDFGEYVKVGDEECTVIDDDCEIFDFKTRKEKIKSIQSVRKYQYLHTLCKDLSKECDIVYTLGFAKGWFVHLIVNQYYSYGHTLDCEPIVICFTDDEIENRIHKEFNLTRYFEEVLKLQNFDKDIGNFKEDFIIKNIQN